MSVLLLAVDVGLIRDRGWGVIESNAAFGSGICGRGPAEVLRCACAPI